ncbi:hypothetical protein [Rhizobium hidalgonense]|uniref:hypothetical protein n=1 Tax=Rhizobium hidalgonense TaxID=1538159 RepID=UPI002871D8E4|nr:hypothetical protein [Rhizobium hidalgonense]MDR9813115.1 hypothetical protein [Rhizobium hidalgonense]
MPTLNIQGQRVKVDDSFLQLSPEEQNKTVEEIAGQLGVQQQDTMAPAGAESQKLASELSGMTQNPAKAIDDQRYQNNRERFARLPGWAKPIVAAQDVGNIIGDAATFGFGDKIAAGIRAPFTDKTYAQELEGMRAGTQQSRDRAGSAAIGADVVGSVAAPMAIAGKGATLAGRLGTGAMTGAKGVVARAGLMGIEGAGYGALGAAGHDTSLGEGAAYGAAGGAAGSMIGDAVGAAVTKASSLLKGKTKVPDLTALKDAEKAAYDASEKAGVIIKPEGVQALSADIKGKLADFGYDPGLQPRIAPVLNRLDDLSNGNITLKGLHTLRKLAGNAAISQDKSERAAAGMVIESIDNFMDNLGPQNVLVGDRLTGPKALKEAISIGKRVRKNENFLNAVKTAKNRADTTGSGGNIENATRQNVRKLLEKGKGFTGDEKAAMQEIVSGTPGQNFLRLAGKLSPQGNGLMAALGVGGAMVNPVFGVASLGGLGAKSLADRGVRQGVEALDVLIRSGGNATALKAAQGTLAQLTQAQREAIARIVTGMALSAGRQTPAQP